jgi:hypothetical protein
MPRMTWNAPERRFFETGLDRGVLYPRKPPVVDGLVLWNLIPNPSFETDTTGWYKYSVGSTGTTTFVSQSSANSTSGASRAQLTATSFGSSSNDRLGAYTEVLSVVSDGDYYLSVDLGSLPPNRQWVIEFQMYDSSDELVGSINRKFSGGGRRGGTFHMDPAASTAQIFIYAAGMDAGSAVTLDTWFDAVILSPGTDEIAYFDGSTGSGTYQNEWTGVAHNSSSRSQAVVTSAVPWDGLTSVEESGGEAARAYYVDGRPFLFLPMPKEYKATLNAYTYPDAFAEIMGLAEVTDGMYLDSQPGKVFDLAYRTLVGNAAGGTEHGYKIHLVYNATVTPGALNYETLSDSVNPSTMSWEIQAVPVTVTGFRPTAHIVIDTRHMDPRKIVAIEELLYGSTDTLAAMPSPQLVFDILNYGDTIIVTDNGDGTFDVEGSYENVYLVGDGEFRVDNVDGQDNGDGTFTISTTEG